MNNESGEMSSEAAIELERMQLDAEFKKFGELCGIGGLFSKLEPKAQAVIESKGTETETDKMAEFQILAETEIDQIDGDRMLATIGYMALNADLCARRGLIADAVQRFDIDEINSLLQISDVLNPGEIFTLARTICERLENLLNIK